MGFDAGRLRLDRLLAAGLAASLALLSLLQIWRGASRMFLLVGAVGILAPVVWILISLGEGPQEAGLDQEPRKDAFLALSAGFFVILGSLSLLTWGVEGARGFESFLLWALLPTFAALAVFRGSRELARPFVLFVAAPLILLEPILAQSLTFPAVFGRDPWIHMAWTGEMIEQAPSFVAIYNGMPVFHSLVGVGMTMTGLDYAAASIGMVALPGAFLLPVAVYYLGATYFGETLGLLSALVAVTGNEVLRMFTVLKPNSLGLIILLLILVLASSATLTGLRAGVVVLFTLLLIGTHSLATLQLALLLVLVWFLISAAEQVGEQSKVWTIPLWVTVVIVGGGAAWWTWISGHMDVLVELLTVDSLFGIGTHTFGGTPDVVTAYRYTLPFLDRFFYLGGLILFCGLAIIGSLYMVSSLDPDHLIWVVASAFPLMIGFGALALGGTLVGQRWWVLAQLLLALQVAIALVLLATRWVPEGKGTVLLGAGVLLLSLSMIVGWTPNLDNADLSQDLGYRNTLTGGELQAVKTLNASTDDIFADQTAARPSYIGYNVTALSEPYVKGGYEDYCHEVFLVREEIREAPMRAYSGIWKAPTDPVEALETECSLIYANGEATAWIDPDDSVLGPVPRP